MELVFDLELIPSVRREPVAPPTPADPAADDLAIWYQRGYAARMRGADEGPVSFAGALTAQFLAYWWGEHDAACGHPPQVAM